MFANTLTGARHGAANDEFEADRLCGGPITRQCWLGDGAGHHAARQSTDIPNAAPPSAGTSANPNASSTRGGGAGLESGANSFTEGQARRRIEDHGYTNVGGLHKDQNSLWQAEAMKDGRRVRVGVDFRGNVAEENP